MAGFDSTRCCDSGSVGNVTGFSKENCSQRIAKWTFESRSSHSLLWVPYEARLYPFSMSSPVRILRNTSIRGARERPQQRFQRVLVGTNEITPRCGRETGVHVVSIIVDRIRSAPPFAPFPTGCKFVYLILNGKRMPSK